MTLERTILEVLELCGTRSLPQRTLFVRTNGLLEKCATEKEFVKALQALKGKGHAVSTLDEDRGEMWAITTSGRNRLKT